MKHSAMDRSARLWAAPDFQSIAFGREGEILAAKVRLVITALVGLIPLESVLVRAPGAEAKIGLGAAITVFALGGIVLRVAQRTKPPSRRNTSDRRDEPTLRFLSSTTWSQAGRCGWFTVSRFSCARAEMPSIAWSIRNGAPAAQACGLQATG